MLTKYRNTKHCSTSKTQITFVATTTEADAAGAAAAIGDSVPGVGAYNRKTLERAPLFPKTTLVLFKIYV